MSLKKNLKLAMAAIEEANELFPKVGIPHGADYGLDINTLIDAFRDSDEPFDWSKWKANLAKRYKGSATFGVKTRAAFVILIARCRELNIRPKIEIVREANKFPKAIPDSEFILIGRAPGVYIRDIQEWGFDAVVCDLVAESSIPEKRANQIRGRCYPAFHILRKRPNTVRLNGREPLFGYESVIRWPLMPLEEDGQVHDEQFSHSDVDGELRLLGFENNFVPVTGIPFNPASNRELNRLMHVYYPHLEDSSDDVIPNLTNLDLGSIDALLRTHYPDFTWETEPNESESVTNELEELESLLDQFQV